MRKVAKKGILASAACLALSVTALAADTAQAAVKINLTFLYVIAAALALAVLIGYCAYSRVKSIVLLYLFLSVFVVNMGYLALALSKSLDEALLANRISYLGAVLLPMWMLLAILDVCDIRASRRLKGVLLALGLAAFLLAASPGYSTLYYESAELVFVGGVAELEKEYGPLHFLYLVYLLGYFVAMLAVVVVARKRKQQLSDKHGQVLLMVVLINIFVWGVEQIVYIPFELLSLSYIVSELMLVSLYGLMQEMSADAPAVPSPIITEVEEAAAQAQLPTVDESGVLLPERVDRIMEAWPAVELLTARERDVLRCLLANKRRREIAELLQVTEHTAKKHTANIFAKLDVSSRRELAERANEETPLN